MSARDTLTPELRAEVLRLEDDLRARVASLPEVQSAWREEYDAARAAERTAASWEAWVDERVTLAAVAWVLTTVFVRFCEDNGLIKPVWISGPRSALTAAKSRKNTHVSGYGRTISKSPVNSEAAESKPTVPVGASTCTETR